MIEFRDALTDLLDEFGTDDHGQSLVITRPCRLLTQCRPLAATKHFKLVNAATKFPTLLSAANLKQLNSQQQRELT